MWIVINVGNGTNIFILLDAKGYFHFFALGRQEAEGEHP
jgi:hypothetical protein